MNKKHKEDLEQQLAKFHEVFSSTHVSFKSGTSQKSDTRRLIFIDGNLIKRSWSD